MTLLHDTLYQKQLDLERDSVERGILRYNTLASDTIQRGDGACLKPAERLLLHWYEAMCKAIIKEKDECTAGIAGVGRAEYGKYVHDLDTPRMALITMHHTVSLCMVHPNGIQTTKTAVAIGRNLSAEIALLLIRDMDRHTWKVEKKHADVWTAVMHTDRRRLRPEKVHRIARKHIPDSIWPLRVQARLGAALLHYLIEFARVPVSATESAPAFDIVCRRRGVKTYKFLKLTPATLEIIEHGHAVRQHLCPRYVPMVVRPMPWTADDAGGYLEHALPLVKRRSYGETPQEPEAVREAVNVMSSVPWRINRRVLDVVIGLWEQGGNAGDIPRATDLSYPTMPADFETNAKAKKQWKADVVDIRGKNINAYADRVNFGYLLDIAQRFRDYGRIYFPHQLDFRGRAYAVPLFLNHQGSDLCRGLLEFATARHCDDNARRWLRIHLANCCGIDKVSFDDRIKWTHNHEDSIGRWANSPLQNLGWLDTESPFQTLAAAMALFDDDAAARLPVQVDGSTNAFQHYAAMLRCPDMARLANLINCDMPADPYAEVAHRALELVHHDIGNGNATAKALEAWITRKVVKQTVMTSPYGVTKIGARRQIHTSLVKAGFADKNQSYAASRYLSQAVLKSVADVCPAAHKAMAWLTTCARIIAKTGAPVRWTTPMGLSVEQPYRNAKSCRVDTMLHQMKLNYLNDECPVSVNRQAQAFAPNWVHSLDASHMMLTALKAGEQQLSFAGVHDSYWTHAADMNTLSTILRQTFVDLYRDPPQIDLMDQFTHEHPHLDFPKAPQVGDFDLSEVLNGPYFFA